MNNVISDGLSYRRPKQDKDSQNEAAAAQRSEKPKHFTGQLFGSQKKEDKEQREEREKKRREEKLKKLDEKEAKVLKASKEKAEKIKADREKRQQAREQSRERKKTEVKPVRRKVEDSKEMKEQKNQAAGAQVKSTALKREKPLTTTRMKSTEAKPVEKPVKKVGSATSKPTGVPKVKKDATNKTKKEEVTKSKMKAAKTTTPALKGKEGEDMKEPIQNGGVPGQSMEIAEDTPGIEDHQAVEDDVEPELERIKDEEDDTKPMREGDIHVPDSIPIELDFVKREAEQIQVKWSTTN